MDGSNNQLITWKLVKEDILRFCGDCNEFTARLAIPVEYLQEYEIRKYVETYNEMFSELEARKSSLSFSVTRLSDSISEKVSGDALLCLEQAIECCAGVFKATLQMWVLSGGM